MAYADSSNLYSFCGGDPVNCKDPTGLQVIEERDPIEEAEAERVEWEHYVRLARRPMRPTARVYAEGSDQSFESRDTTPFFLLSPGQRLLGGKTANALTPVEQEQFLAHRRRLRTDPAYRAWWAQVSRTSIAEVMPNLYGQVPLLPGVTPYSQQIQANPALAAQLTAYHNNAVSARTSEQRLLAPSTIVPNAGGIIRSFVTTQEEIYYRVFSKKQQGSYLVKKRPANRALAIEGQGENTGDYIQEVRVPAGVRLQRSRALPAFGHRGGLEQFQLLTNLPPENFGPGMKW